MSYNKTNWNTGDVITAEKLNHMEDGIESSTRIKYIYVTDDGDGGAIFTDYDEIPYTYSDIKNFYDDGYTIVCIFQRTLIPVECEYEDDDFKVDYTYTITEYNDSNETYIEFKTTDITIHLESDPNECSSTFTSDTFQTPTYTG